MNLTDLARELPAFYQSGKCLYLKSGPGRGKTTTIIDSIPHIAAATGKNLGVSIISGPLLTPADAQGYLVVDRTPDGRVESKYTDPFWWRTAEGKRLEEYDGGVIFIDEADKMDVDVKKVVGEMALSGRWAAREDWMLASSLGWRMDRAACARLTCSVKARWDASMTT